MILWWEWWERQAWTDAQRIAYFDRWRPPKRWLAFVLRAIWPEFEEADADSSMDVGFERAAQLGWGTRAEYEHDLAEPKWLKE